MTLKKTCIYKLVSTSLPAVHRIGARSSRARAGKQTVGNKTDAFTDFRRNSSYGNIKKVKCVFFGVNWKSDFAEKSSLSLILLFLEAFWVPGSNRRLFEPVSLTPPAAKLRLKFPSSHSFVSVLKLDQLEQNVLMKNH